MTLFNTEKLKNFRRRLQAIREEIMALLRQTACDTKPVDLDLPIGRLSRADAMQMQSMATLNKRQLEFRLKQVEGALSAIEDHSYGRCRGCNEPIPPARLDVRPETPFCIACQEEFEQRR